MQPLLSACCLLPAADCPRSSQPSTEIAADAPEDLQDRQRENDGEDDDEDIPPRLDRARDEVIDRDDQRPVDNPNREQGEHDVDDGHTASLDRREQLCSAGFYRVAPGAATWPIELYAPLAQKWFL